MHLKNLPTGLIPFLHSINGASVAAIVLMGSHANNQAQTFSDIDLVRFVYSAPEPLAGAGCYLVDDALVVVSDVKIETIGEYFTIPEKIIDSMHGLRTAHVLVERDRFFADLQKRAKEFTWSLEIQEKANQWASEQMVGWMEEINKGLNGLQTNDIGRLLNAKFGLCWGLSRIIAVQKGIFSTSDNAILTDIQYHLGIHSQWCKLQLAAFGLSGNHTGIDGLKQDVIACLNLYQSTANLIQSALVEPQKTMIERTCLRIDQELNQRS